MSFPVGNVVSLKPSFLSVPTLSLLFGRQSLTPAFRSHELSVLPPNISNFIGTCRIEQAAKCFPHILSSLPLCVSSMALSLSVLFSLCGDESPIFFPKSVQGIPVPQVLLPFPSCAVTPVCAVFRSPHFPSVQHHP